MPAPRSLVLFAVAALIAALSRGTASAAPHSFLRDGGFEQSAPGGVSPAWVIYNSADVVRDVHHGGAQSLRINGAATVEQNVFSLVPGRWYACSGWIRTQDVHPANGNGFAYLAIYQYDDAGSLLAFTDFAQVKGSSDWTCYTYAFQVAAGAARVALRAGIFQAGGTAWIDDLTLIEGREPAEWEPAMDVASTVAERPDRVAVLRDDLPGMGAPSSPDHLAHLLNAAGIETRLLAADELADPGTLNRSNFDLVVLPYGPTFPVAAHRAFQQFLVEGGDFVSMGGYAFDNLVAHTPQGWLPQTEALKGQEQSVPIGGDFEGAPWQTDTPEACAVVADVVHSGKHALRVQLPPAAAALSAGWHHDVPAEPGQEYMFSGWIKAGALGREADGFAYLAVYQYGPDDKLVTFRDITNVIAPQDWQRYEWRFRVAEGVTRVRLIAGLYNTSGAAWFDDLALVRVPPIVQMNTRTGVPADGLQVSPLQIGAFDPSYPLERAAFACGSESGLVFPVNLKIDGPFEGYAASGVVGYNQARWVSLLDARDRYGRLRGSIGALLRNYAGAYARSSWAFFGVTNRDLFASGNPEMEQGFVRLVKLMLADTYLHNLETDRACYNRGETVKIAVRVSNFGRHAREVTVGFDVQSNEPAARGRDAAGIGIPALQAKPAGKPTPAEVTRTLAPGETAIIQTEWTVTASDANFYRVTTILSLDGRPEDRVETGFCITDDRAIASGPAVVLKGNYLEAGGARRFLLGTDTYGNMFGSAAQNPLTWARDLAGMRDNGIAVYENLQFYPGSFPTPYVADERTARQARAMVQLAQQLRLIYVPGLLIGYDTAATNGLLKQEAEWCTAFPGMCSNAPGMIYYTNGDLRLDMQDTPELRELYQSLLKERYGTPAALQQAWQAEPPIASFDQVAVASPTSRGWDDLRVRDWRLFEQWLVRRWLTAMHDASKAGAPERPTTVEFYQSPYGGIDLRATLGPINIGNMGYFGLKGSDIAQFPSRFKFSDMRAYGQSLSIGEFGCKTHPAWAQTHDYHQTRTEREQIDLYLAVPHYALGLGGSKVHNWCWSDAEESIFPWGLVHSNDRVAKRVLSAYRNTALLFKHFEPEYRPPAVWVVTPTSHRAGANGDQVYQATLTCIQGLIEERVDFGVIDEDRLQALPPGAQALFWPLPYCPTDATVVAVGAFARRGGHVYVSGDFSFGPDRKRTRAYRLERLAGVRFVRQNFQGIAVPRGEPQPAQVGDDGWAGLASWRGWPTISIAAAGAKVIARGLTDEPRLVVNRIGKGEVVYTPDVLEATPDSGAVLRAIYRAVLGSARVPRVQIEPDIAGIHAFRVPTRGDGAAYVLFNANATDARTVTLRTDHHMYQLRLGPQRPGLILEDAGGHTLGIEAGGLVRRDGQTLASADVHFMLTAEDGRDVLEPRALLLMPLGEGKIRISGWGADKTPASTKEGQEISAQVGEVAGGEWTPFETFAPRRTAQGIELDIDPDRAVSLILLAPNDELALVGQKVAHTLTEP